MLSVELTNVRHAFGTSDAGKVATHLIAGIFKLELVLKIRQYFKTLISNLTSLKSEVINFSLLAESKCLQEILHTY